ncbi:MAG: ATP-dependent RecD-like DNA helicase [Candidatus Babeliales bacterium]
MNNITPDELSGVVDRFIFQNTDNGYGVMVLTAKASKPITVIGHFPNINPGQQVHLVGHWIMHPKFGKQFEAKTCISTLPNTLVGLKKYLASGLIKGIGPAYAEKLVSYFGTDVLTVIDTTPERLTEVPGIGNSRAATIKDAWKDQKEIANVMVFLQEKGISTTYATKIYKTYGQQSITVITENPYRLADDIWGIGFKIADAIAHNLGIAHNSLQRIKAGIIYTLTTLVNNGHLYGELQELKTTTVKLLEIVSSSSPLEDISIEPTIKQAFHELYDTHKIKLITYNEQHFVGLTSHYFSEKGVANHIRKLIDYPPMSIFNLDEIYQTLRVPRNEHDYVLNEEQQEGILACLRNKITIITGGPGTGKTTIIKKLLSILDEYHITYKLAAPTGRAAKRIIESTGRHASTLHRLLEYDFASHGFAHNETNALKLHFLIIDEASMIDIFLAHAVLKALPLPAHLILIGDIDQLPSVGAGNFLNDLIASKVVPTIRLKQIFRQAQDSLIVVNAHRVNNGEFPTSSLPNAKRDFIFIKEDNPEQVQAHLESIIKNQLQRYGIKSENSIVLVPMNRGVVGTQTINHFLQTIINPSSTAPHVMYSGTTFKVNDRVMQIRNNYDKLVFNGDTGIISAIDTAERIVTINFYDRDIVYEFNDLDEIVLAYAITIHKSQGSEYAAVIIPIFMQHFTLLQRNLIYTAITRAKKLCILIGQTKAIGMALRNNKGIERTTFLVQFLTSDLQCR